MKFIIMVMVQISWRDDFKKQTIVKQKIKIIINR